MLHLLRRSRAPGLPLLALGALAPAAADGDVIIEATGTVFSANPSGASAFVNTRVGNPVLVHLEVNTPGMDVAPGQYTQYGTGAIPTNP